MWNERDSRGAERDLRRSCYGEGLLAELCSDLGVSKLSTIRCAALPQREGQRFDPAQLHQNPSQSFGTSHRSGLRLAGACSAITWIGCAARTPADCCCIGLTCATNTDCTHGCSHVEQARLPLSQKRQLRNTRGILSRTIHPRLADGRNGKPHDEPWRASF